MLTLAALALSAATIQEPQEPLLPATPAGWSRELIPFPLSFAPELAFEGVEELLFAPGMFARESSSYFSYALALRLEGEHEVDEAFLDAFLEGYYRGLCAAVAEGNNLELDLDAVAAVVVRQGESFRAEVDAFDAFNTGEPLHLRIDLDVHQRPRATEVLGLASPLAADAPIWNELRALRDAWSAARPAPVFLNHVFFVPDEETYAALGASEVLRDLAVFETRTTVRPDLSYTGLYFYGAHTYFEFLQPNPAAGFPPGSAGVAFGVDRAGGVERAERALSARDLRTFPAPVTRALEGEQVPWFRMLGLEMTGASSPLVFLMEYDPQFLARWHPELPPAGGGIARAGILQRYAAALQRERGPLQEVTAVDLALDAAERDRLAEAGEALGHELEESEGVWILRAPGFELRMHAAAEGARASSMLGFELSLREELDHAPLRLGRATLTFEGRAAAFRFGE